MTHAVDLGDRRELFVDDHVIDTMDNSRTQVLFAGQ